MRRVDNPFIPRLARIIDIRDETPDTKTFKVSFINHQDFSIVPGQFMELTVFGYGEAPFSISAFDSKTIELTIRRMGTVTTALFKLGVGGIIGLRGPLGNGWPLDKLNNRNILIVAGGIGLAPLRPLIHYIIDHRSNFGDVILFYGARTPSDLLYKGELMEWDKHINVYLTVDRGDESWTGRVGVVTILFDEIKVSPENTIALQCGPSIMMHFVTKKLREIGFNDDQIYLSLERLMKCGMGMCGKCTISGTYVCLNGPVFCCSEIKGFVEKIPEIG